MLSVCHWLGSDWLVCTVDDDECEDVADDTGDDTADDLTTMRPPGCCNGLSPRPHPVRRLPSGPGDHQTLILIFRFYNRVNSTLNLQHYEFYDLFLSVCQCVCIFSVCCVSFHLSLLGRVVVKLLWLILMVVLDSTLKYFVLSLFVCLRLGGHSQLPSVLVLSVFNSVRNFGENQKLRARKWIINKLSRRVCDYPGVLVNLSIGILVYFFLDKCKYNDAEGVLLAAQCPARVTGGCWTQLKPNQDGAESRQ